MNSEAIDLLTHLVSIPSPSEQEAAASAYLVEWMQAHGLHAYVDDAGSAVDRPQRPQHAPFDAFELVQHAVAHAAPP